MKRARSPANTPNGGPSPTLHTQPPQQAQRGPQQAIQELKSFLMSIGLLWPLERQLEHLEAVEAARRTCSRQRCAPAGRIASRLGGARGVRCASGYHP